MEFNRIGVVGAGTMGNGISQALAASGFEVVMTDVAQAQIDRGLAAISGGCDRLGKREKMTELSALRYCDLLIEAATENLELKLKLFRQLDELLPEHAVLASNTSSISITRLAAVTKRADRVVGMHFFNPVAMMALVELIRGLQTSDPSYAAVEALARRIGKSPVSVRNSPGFVVNRVLCPIINEAIFALGEGLASAREIDEAMKLGANHPMGPLALADLIGLDVELAVMQVLYEGFKDPKYRPAPLLVEMVEAGYLGRKSGRGFHRYDQ